MQRRLAIERVAEPARAALCREAKTRAGGTLNREALRELILRFALLLEETPELVEADLNSLCCTTTASLVLDMRLQIERERVKTW